MGRRKASSRPPHEAAPEEDGGVDVVTEEAPQEQPEPRQPERVTSRRRGANFEVKASGSAEAIREGMEQMTGGEEEAQADPRPKEEVEEDDRLAEQLANPKNFVRVTRLYPRRHRMRKCDVQVEQYRCPITRQDIEEDVFERFGGKRFLISIHPNTPTGASKTIGTITIENPDMDKPIMATDPANDEFVIGDGADPLAAERDDPMTQIESDLEQQARIAAKMSRINSMKELTKSLGGKKDDDGERDRRERLRHAQENDARVQALEDRLGMSQMESRMDRRMEKLEALIGQQATNGSGGKEDATMRLVIQLIQSSDNRFQTMMQTMMQSGKKEETMDTMLDKLAKLKSVFGQDNARVNKLEETLLNFAEEKLLGDGNGGGDGDADSDVKYAVKQFVPLARTYIEKKLDGPSSEGRVPTEAEFKKAVAKESERIAVEMAKDWEKKGYLVKLPQRPGQQALPAPAAKPSKVGAPTEQKRREAPPKETPQPTEEAPTQEEDASMDVPPSPQAPNYDRKAAVDFVLDMILEDIDAGCPPNTFVIGDILDRLDDEILHGLTEISTGDDLEKLIGPYADPQRLAEVKEKGKDQTVKSWLKRIIVTAQDEIVKLWKSAEDKAKKEAEAK